MCPHLSVAPDVRTSSRPRRDLAATSPRPLRVPPAQVTRPPRRCTLCSAGTAAAGRRGTSRTCASRLLDPVPAPRCLLFAPAKSHALAHPCPPLHLVRRSPPRSGLAQVSFSATPSEACLRLFGVLNHAHGVREAFHNYSLRQARATSRPLSHHCCRPSPLAPWAWLYSLCAPAVDPFHPQPRHPHPPFDRSASWRASSPAGSRGRPLRRRARPLHHRPAVAPRPGAPTRRRCLRSPQAAAAAARAARGGRAARSDAG